MKNSHLPAHPIELSGFGLYAPEAHYGLTKREMFAMAAMQGLCAHGGDYLKIEHLAADAVNYADAVLKMLEVR